MMDVNDAYPGLRESTEESVSSARALADEWHNSFDGRVRYAHAPRFVLSCTDNLLRQVSEMVDGTDGILLHTHASEQIGEIDAVRARCGMENIEYLNHVGLLSPKSCLAHCVHLNEREIGLLASAHASVTHCPSSNLKLGSGVADVPLLRSKNINVSLGADGAPCNNRLDMFAEMRLASLLQKPRHGPTVMPAAEVLEIATMGGARTLGLDKEIGSIEPGKKADLVLLDLRQTWNSLTESDLYSSIVYSATPENVDSVMIDGRWIYQHKSFLRLDVEKILLEARGELRKLLSRVVYN
jgi:cytosine/adenosine deaminase-related metal-dependent hydrolase